MTAWLLLLLALWELVMLQLRPRRLLHGACCFEAPRLPLALLLRALGLPERAAAMQHHHQPHWRTPSAAAATRAAGTWA
jgi:hypothetical protein